MPRTRSARTRWPRAATSTSSSSSTEGRKVVGQQPIDQLLHASASLTVQDQVGPLLKARERVGHRDAALAGAEEGMVVLGVAHRHRVARRQDQLVEGGGE